MNHRRPLTSRNRGLLLTVFLLLTAHCSLLTVAHAQSASATLSGAVTDQNRAAIPGATITILNTATSLQRQATTNDEGYFVVPLLSPGTYIISARRDGFAPLDIPNVILNVGDQKALQIQLKAGDVNATVTIDSNAETVRTDPSVGTVVDRQFIENVPLSGRSFHSLLELTPGVTLFKVGANPSGGQFSINGQRTDANYFMVDGVSANSAIVAAGFGGQAASGSLPGLTALGSTQSLVSVDSLQEFRVQTSTYAPEFGRTPGGQISMITRSGANDFHGTAFEYFRNEALDANDWFANANRRTKPPERQHDFGGTLSGPVVLPRFGEGGHQPWYNGRNQAFFFFSYEGLRLHLPVVQIVGVPTLALRQQVSSAVRALLDAFPLPNGADLGNGIAQFAGSYADPSQLDATAFRLDHSFGRNVTTFGRYSHTPSVSATRARSLSSISETHFENDSLTAGLTWILSSRLTNDIRANWTWTRGLGRFNADTFGGAVVPSDSAILPSPLNTQTANATLTLNGTSGFIIGTGKDNFQRQFNIVDGFTWSKSLHSLKLGLDYRRISPILGRAGANFVTYAFGATANVVAGRSAFVQLAAGAGENIALFTNFSAYVQDTWNATQRLSLTYGVRWEFNPPPKSLNGRLPVTIADIKAQPSSLSPRSTPLWKTTYNNFAPRIGLAYRLSQAPGRELVARGGFGVFYDTGFGVSAVAFDTVYPYFASKVTANVAFPLTGADAQLPVPGVGSPQQLWISDRNLKLPYTYQWNAAAEQSLGPKQTVSLSYVGSRGRRLLRRSGYSLRFNEFGATPVVTYFSSNSARSDYKAFQAQFQRRLSQGLQALVNYTLSKSNDIVSDDGGFQSSLATANQIDLSHEYGPSDFDVRHVFTAGVTYDLPKPGGSRLVRAVFGGWGLDGLARFRTGFPLNVYAVVPFIGGTQAVRPDVNPGVSLLLSGPQYPGGKAVNRAAFAVPTTGTVGNFPRNSLRGFPAQQIDLTLRRQFGLSEKTKLQFRFDVFNLFNHPNFADPVTNTSLVINQGSTFGVSTQSLNRGLGGLNALYQMGGPRSAQLGIKLLF